MMRHQGAGLGHSATKDCGGLMFKMKTMLGAFLPSSAALLSAAVLMGSANAASAVTVEYMGDRYEITTVEAED